MIQDLDRIESRLERIEAKLDNHLERVSKVEASLDSVRGSIKILVSTVTAIVTTGIMVLVQLFIKWKA